VRADLHVHTDASFDSKSRPGLVMAQCRRLGLDPVVVTDHGTVSAAVRLQGLTLGHRVVIGEEIMTTEGEIIGLFLTSAITGTPTPKEAAIAIKEQGGLVYLEHPYDSFRRHMSERAIEEIAGLIDIVEVFNGRSEPKANQRAEDLCSILGTAPGAGSDAHTIGEIGTGFVEIEDFTGPMEFLDNLRRGRIIKGRSKVRLMVEARLTHRMPRR
jgi:predicted metal-dependent phosphoesterase TrpH